MLISIIIPSFQIGNELENALQSIENQDFKSYEIIIIDACSTDNTVEVVNKYKNLSIIFIQEKDSGVYDAMNKGIKYAKGDWLYFMGGDDVLCDRILQNISSELIDSNYYMVYGNVIMKSDGAIYAGEFDLSRLLYQENICHQAIFYKKQVFEKLGNYNLDYKIWGDWDFNIRFFKHPELRAKYIDINISLYNDESGVSSFPDTVFAKELPVVYINKINVLESQRAEMNHRYASLERSRSEILASGAFIIGTKLVRLINKFRLGNFIKYFITSKNSS